MSIFIAVALSGLIVLFVALLFGGDHDFGEHELELDHDMEHDHSVESHGPSPFSIRILSLFAVAFGASGSIASYYGFSATASSLVGVLGGVAVGWLGWRFMRLLWDQQASSIVSHQEMVGEIAEVTTAIPTSGLGEVSVALRGQRFYRSARSEDGKSIESGKTVLIVAFPADIAIVTRADRA